MRPLCASYLSARLTSARRAGAWVIWVSSAAAELGEQLRVAHRAAVRGSGEGGVGAQRAGHRAVSADRPPGEGPARLHLRLALRERLVGDHQADGSLGDADLDLVAVLDQRQQAAAR